MPQGINAWEGQPVDVVLLCPASTTGGSPQREELEGVLERVEDKGIMVVSRRGYKAGQVVFLPWNAVISISHPHETDFTEREGL